MIFDLQTLPSLSLVSSSGVAAEGESSAKSDEMNNVTSQPTALSHNASQNTNGGIKQEICSPDNNSSNFGVTPNRTGTYENMLVLKFLQFYVNKCNTGSSTPAGDSSALEDDEPVLEPVNGMVQPPVVPPEHRPGRLTNQLKYLQQVVVKAIWRHHFSWPFQSPVNAIALNIPVCVNFYILFMLTESE